MCHALKTANPELDDESDDDNDSADASSGIVPTAVSEKPDSVVSAVPISARLRTRGGGYEDDELRLTAAAERLDSTHDTERNQLLRCVYNDD